MTTDIEQTPHVLAEVFDERARQESKWGPQQHSDLEWLAILTEEVGEVAKALCEIWISGSGREAVRKELIHVAAVAVAATEDMGRVPE